MFVRLVLHRRDFACFLWFCLREANGSLAQLFLRRKKGQKKNEKNQHLNPQRSIFATCLLPLRIKRLTYTYCTNAYTFSVIYQCSPFILQDSLHGL